MRRGIFHLSTFLADNIVSIAWFLLAFESKYESIRIIYMTALIWSGFLLLHFSYFLTKRKSTIRNLDKEDLPPIKHNINITTGLGGNVIKDTGGIMQNNSIYSGSKYSFIITPNFGYSIDEVSGCNGILNGNTFTGYFSAVNTCGVSNAGVNKWQLPSVQDLIGILEFGNLDDSTEFDHQETYWTRDSCSSATSTNRWVVNMETSEVSCVEEGISEQHYIHAVYYAKKNQYSGSFVSGWRSYLKEKFDGDNTGDVKEFLKFSEGLFMDHSLFIDNDHYWTYKGGNISWSKERTLRLEIRNTDIKCFIYQSVVLS